jgi:hypothetical protein
MKRFALSLVLAWLGGPLAATAADELPLNPHLEPLRPFLEKTWKGTFNNSKPDKPTIDVKKWERALNGEAVRCLHSVNDGAYGGESLLFWDDQRKIISVYYFTTAGFMTTGTLEFKDGKFIGHEDVKGNADGITEVRSISEILPNGKFHVKAEYLKDGKWTFGREVTYEESPGTEVIFK